MKTFAGFFMQRNRTNNRKRITIIFFMVFFVMMFLMGRLVYLMVFCSEYYGKKAQDLHERERDIKAARGRILDRNGNVLATNRSVCTISVIHSQITDAEAVIQMLVKELDMTEEKIRARVEKNSSIERIKTNVDKETGDRIRSYGLSGVKVDEDYKRYYPYDTLGSSVLGFTGADNQGIVGLEVQYDDKLQGKNGKILTLTDSRGIEIENAGERRLEPVNGNDLVISLDYNIQMYCEQAAERVYRKKSADRVSIIVMNPQNGELLATVNFPEYNLNEPFTLNLSDEEIAGLSDTEKQNALNRMWRNPCISDTYEPGSTFKIITAAAALEEGVVKVSDTFYCPGYRIVEDRRIRCSRTTGHGSQDFCLGIMNSCKKSLLKDRALCGIFQSVRVCKKQAFDQANGRMGRKMYDVVIIGAGISGSAVARELSRYDLSICVVEKEEDVCCGTTKANSAIVHAGFDAEAGSLMAKLNVEGNEMMEELSKELDFHFKRNGSLVVCLNEEDKPGLMALYERGIKNGVKELRIIEREELVALEPNIADEAVAALYAPTGGIVCPFGMNYALAENAAVNGVEFKFDTEVTGFEKKDDRWVVKTTAGDIETTYVVNAAGVYADVFHNMVSEKKIHITPRRGDYCLLDRSTGGFVSHTIFQLPNKFGKGVLVTPTVHGNTLVGPTAIDIEDKEGVNTTQEGIDELITKAGSTVKGLPIRQVITSFAGLRAHEDGHEFCIGELEDAKGFIDCAGIESPGLSSAPAIGKMVAGIVRNLSGAKEKADFVATRKGILDPKTLSKEEYAALIKEKPEYGNIICRCEMITEGEIMDAIHRPIGAKSLDGVKRRTRAGMGRCQSGFCSPKTIEILARERGVDPSEITKSGGNSKIIVGINKDRL